MDRLKAQQTAQIPQYLQAMMSWKMLVKWKRMLNRRTDSSLKYYKKLDGLLFVNYIIIIGNIIFIDNINIVSNKMSTGVFRRIYF